MKAQRGTGSKDSKAPSRTARSRARRGHGRLRIPLALLGAILAGRCVRAGGGIPEDLEISRVAGLRRARFIELEASSAEWAHSSRAGGPVLTAEPSAVPPRAKRSGAKTRVGKAPGNRRRGASIVARRPASPGESEAQASRRKRRSQTTAGPSPAAQRTEAARRSEPGAPEGVKAREEAGPGTSTAAGTGKQDARRDPPAATDGRAERLARRRELMHQVSERRRQGATEASA